MKLFLKSISNIFSGLNLANRKNQSNLEYEELPKKIYVYWHDGFENIPPIVQLCIQLLEELNPEFDLIKLDKTVLVEISEKLNLSMEEIPVQTISDIVRVFILKQYGGIWADATVLPVIPFKNWLPENIKKGFFAFRCHHAPYALISSWFLVSYPAHKVVKYWLMNVCSFWIKPRTLLMDPRNGNPTPEYPLFEVVQNANNSNTYPYFWLHYLFTAMILADLEIRRVWDEVPTISSTPLHALQNYMKSTMVVNEDEVMKILEHSIVEKLDWRLQINNLDLIYQSVMKINKKL